MEKNYSVIDLFCGIGGLSTGFKKAGFTIVYAADINKKIASIYNQIHNENICIPTNILETPLSSIPDSDIIVGGLPYQAFSSTKWEYSRQNNTFLSYYLELFNYKKPIAFLLEASPFQHKAPIDLPSLFSDFDMIGYQIYHKTLECSMFSALPVYDRKTYIIGIRNDFHHHPYVFPSASYENNNLFEKTDFFENHNTIDPRYRQISIHDDYNFEQGKYYLKHHNKIYESKFFYLSRIYTNYIFDINGLRRLTHSEIAYLKGLPKYNYNNFSNKQEMYDYLLGSSNVYTTYALAEQLICYLKGETATQLHQNDKYQLMRPHEFMTLLQPSHINHLKLELSTSQTTSTKSPKDEWSSLINSIDDASLSGQERGTALEDLMVKFFSQIEGFDCRKNKRTKTEEVDIVIANKNKSSAFANESPIFLCECKNYNTPVTRKELNIFIEKMRNRNQRCKLGFFVAWNGVSEGFEEELLRKSESENLIIILKKDGILKAIHEQDFLKFLEDKYYDVIMK